MDLKEMLVTVIIIAIIAVVSVVIVSKLSKTSIEFLLLPLIPGTVFNESFSGSLDSWLAMSIVEHCGTAECVNGSSGRWDSDLEFVFSASDETLNTNDCVLWSNWTGSWASNDSMTAINSYAVVGEFNVTLPISNEAYVWAVYCNDTDGNGAFSDNRTVLITQGVLA